MTEQREPLDAEAGHRVHQGLGGPADGIGHGNVGAAGEAGQVRRDHLTVSGEMRAQRGEVLAATDETVLQDHRFSRAEAPIVQHGDFPFSRGGDGSLHALAIGMVYISKLSNFVRVVGIQ